MKLKETDHGLYMIGSDGYCNSHSQKEFNCAFKSFEFVENDLINVEYDPIDKMLRFIRLVKQDLFQKVSPKFFISTF